MGSHTSASPSIRTLDALRHIVRALRVSASAAEAHGLSSAQLFVLSLLAEQPAQSMNDLAARTLTHQSSVSVVVSKLVDRGLVARRAVEGDARKIELRITPEGRLAHRRAPQMPQRRLVAALEQMRRSDLTTLARLLTQLAVEISEPGAPPLFFEESPRTRKRVRAPKAATR